MYTEGLGEVNHLPFSPAVISPEIDEVINNASVLLSWASSDVDVDDVLAYDVYLGLDNPPITTVSMEQSEKKYTASSLDAATTYYWKIVVKDGNGAATIGPVWSFKTE